MGSQKTASVRTRCLRNHLLLPTSPLHDCYPDYSFNPLRADLIRAGFRLLTQRSQCPFREARQKKLLRVKSVTTGQCRPSGQFKKTALCMRGTGTEKAAYKCTCACRSMCDARNVRQLSAPFWSHLTQAKMTDFEHAVSMCLRMTVRYTRTFLHMPGHWVVSSLRMMCWGASLFEMKPLLSER